MDINKGIYEELIPEVSFSNELKRKLPTIYAPVKPLLHDIVLTYFAGFLSETQGRSV